MTRRVMATIAFIGDVMLGRGVDELIGRNDPDSFWGDVLPVLQAADAVVANLECAITALDCVLAAEKKTEKPEEVSPVAEATAV